MRAGSLSLGAQCRAALPGHNNEVFGADAFIGAGLANSGVCVGGGGSGRCKFAELGMRENKAIAAAAAIAGGHNNVGASCGPKRCLGVD